MTRRKRRGGLSEEAEEDAVCIDVAKEEVVVVKVAATKADAVGIGEVEE